MSYSLQKTRINNPNFLLYRAETASIEPFIGVIDYIPEEQHAVEVGVSEYPIETGATLVDHVFIKPKELTVTGFVGNLLIPENTILNTPYRDREAWGKILDQIEKRERFTVVTLLAVYDNMILTSAKAEKNVTIGKGLSAKFSFKESLVANTAFTQLPETQLTGPATNKASEINGGQKQSLETTSTQNDGYIFKLLDYLSGALSEFQEGN